MRTCVAVCCSVLQCVAVCCQCCSVMQCDAVCCSVLQCVWCRSFSQMSPIKNVALLCLTSIVAKQTSPHIATHCNTLQRTATHCNTLQHTATILSHRPILSQQVLIFQVFFADEPRVGLDESKTWLFCGAWKKRAMRQDSCSVLQCVVVCCSVL